MPPHPEPHEEAAALIEMFGDRAAAAVERRIALAIERGQLDDAMFWLDVQSSIYLTPYS